MFFSFVYYLFAIIVIVEFMLKMLIYTYRITFN